MSARIRIGLAGTGDIGRLHARALRKRQDVDLCVAAGSDYAKAELFAREHGAALYPSYAEMLADPSVAGVDICVPNDLHRVYTEQAAAAGKAILCEKPMALTIEDAEVMREAARCAGVPLMIAHVLRFWHEYARMREILRSGEMGACLAITMRRMLSLQISVAGERGWRRLPERMGGAMLDLQIHDLDFLYWTFGFPARVFCAAPLEGGGAQNHVYATLVWPGGPAAMVESSYLLQGDPMVFTVKAVCERGTLDYALDIEAFTMHAMAGSEAGRTATQRPATLVRYSGGSAPEPVLCQEPDILDAAFARELSYFADCVAGRANDLLPVEDSIAALRLALACRDSALSGRVVELNA